MREGGLLTREPPNLPAEHCSQLQKVSSGMDFLTI